MTRRKITFIGAGSVGFTRGLARDILTFPAFRDAHLCLMDIDAERLRMAERAVRLIVEAGKYPAQVTATMDRAEALQGANGVLCTILSGGVQVWRYDIEIPRSTAWISTWATPGARPASSDSCAPPRHAGHLPGHRAVLPGSRFP
jgi:alpha-galactosidase